MASRRSSRHLLLPHPLPEDPEPQSSSKRLKLAATKIHLESYFGWCLRYVLNFLNAWKDTTCIFEKRDTKGGNVANSQGAKGSSPKYLRRGVKFGVNLPKQRKPQDGSCKSDPVQPISGLLFLFTTTSFMPPKQLETRKESQGDKVMSTLHWTSPQHLLFVGSALVKNTHQVTHASSMGRSAVPSRPWLEGSKKLVPTYQSIHIFILFYWWEKTHWLGWQSYWSICDLSTAAFEHHLAAEVTKNRLCGEPRCIQCLSQTFKGLLWNAVMPDEVFFKPPNGHKFWFRNTMNNYITLRSTLLCTSLYCANNFIIYTLLPSPKTTSGDSMVFTMAAEAESFWWRNLTSSKWIQKLFAFFLGEG